MTNAYRVSSSLKVEQMEAELSHQLSELRAEIEENGFPPRSSASKSYRCVSLAELCGYGFIMCTPGSDNSGK